MLALLRRWTRGLLGTDAHEDRLDGCERPEQTLHTRWMGDAATARSRVSEARARRLLMHLLDPRQLQELERHGCFTVRVQDRGTFCIVPRSTFNVIHLQSGNLYCCTTEAFVPLSDLMLTQKLLLENDPDRFFAAANCRPETFAGPQEQLLRRVLGGEANAPRAEQRTIW